MNVRKKEGSRLLNLIKIRAKSNKIKYYEPPNKFEVFAILASLLYVITVFEPIDLRIW